MFSNLSSYLQPVKPYQNPLTGQRAQSLLDFLFVSFLVSILVSIFLILQTLSGMEDGNFALNPADIPGILSPIIILAFHWGVRHGYYRTSSYGVVIFVLSTLTTFWNAPLNTVGVIIFAIPIVVCGLLLGSRSTVATFLMVLLFASGPLLLSNQGANDFFTLATALFLITMLMIAFGTTIQRSAFQFIRELSKLQDLMGTTAQSTIERNENQAIVNTINIIRDSLGYTFARVYLVEDNEVISRIQTGLNLTQINVDTDIQFGSRSGIHEAIRTGDLLFIQENADPLLRQHLLSGTRAALAVPVKDSTGTIVAVLDIQSEDLSTYNDSELTTIKMVASQLGLTIENARIINSLRRDLLEQDELIERQRERLLRYEYAERQVTTDTWREYLQQQGVEYLGYDMNDLLSDPVEASTLSDEIQAAIQTGDIKVETENDQQLVSVPIQLRGQTLGAMSFRVPMGSQVVGARQQELIRNVVQRLSLALENKRLFEQSQSQAFRESKANEIGSLLLSSTDVNTVLQLAARNFNEVLGSIQTQIRLKPEAQETGEREVNS